MKATPVWFVVLSLALLGASLSRAQNDSSDRGYDSVAAVAGAETYKRYCATCHGKAGGGDGPLASSLRVVPADLTKIAKHNGGRFPFEKVRRIIDGRQPVKGHGNSDMPAWGDALKQSVEGYDAETVDRKITQLVHYLASLQPSAP